MKLERGVFPTAWTGSNHDTKGYSGAKPYFLKFSEIKGVATQVYQGVGDEEWYTIVYDDVNHTGWYTPVYSHMTSTDEALTDASKWRMSNMQFVATSVFFAQMAYIENLGVRNVLLSDGSTIEGGMCHSDKNDAGGSLGLGDVRFWLGAANPALGKIRGYKDGKFVAANGKAVFDPSGDVSLCGGNAKFDKDGNTTIANLTATNGNFSGELHSSKGQVGGFELADGRIGDMRDNAMSGEGMTITQSYVRAGISGCYGAIGSDLLGSTVSGGAIQYAGYISSTRSNYKTDMVPHANYGMSVNVQNSETCIGMDVTVGNSSLQSIGLNFNISGSNRCYAFCGTGTGVLRGLMEGYRLNVMQFSDNDGETRMIDLRNGKYVMLGVDKNNCSLLLPSLSNVCEALNIGHDSPGDIAVRLTIYSRWSTQSVSIIGRKHIKDQPWDYPLLRDNNNNDNWSVSMTAGDTLELLLTHCYAGREDSYNAYILSHMN